MAVTAVEADSAVFGRLAEEEDSPGIESKREGTGTDCKARRNRTMDSNSSSIAPSLRADGYGPRGPAVRLPLLWPWFPRLPGEVVRADQLLCDVIG